MRSTLSRAVLLLVALTGPSLSACGSDADDYSSTSSSALDPQAVAIQALQDRDATFESYSDADLQAIANGICDAFDAGMTLDEATQYATNSGFDYTKAGYLLGFAVAGTCPEHRSSLS